MCNFVLSIPNRQNMIALINKKEKTCRVAMDRTRIAELIRVHPITIKRHLPYWETGDFIIAEAEYIKTIRGK